MDRQEAGDRRAGDPAVKPGSALAIYLLFWTITLFAVLPFGVRTPDEDGAEPVPGQAPSAPTNPMIGRKLAWTTLISALLFGLFMANDAAGWVTMDDVPFWRTRGPYAPKPA
jgi:predicted secreted protein